MTPKPSLRRDSLEKAARKLEADWSDEDYPQITRDLVRFATRHGAKVRRETLKEAAAELEFIFHVATRLDAQKKILSLTPRGPEKGGKP